MFSLKITLCSDLIKLDRHLVSGILNNLKSGIMVDQQQQQQQLSHLFRVFGVGYMNQKRITPDRAHESAFSIHSYCVIYLH